MKRGIVGTDSLNIQLQNVLNPKGEELSKGGKCFRINDKVMQVRNNYDKEVSYDYAELDELVLAYAVSVHKSQGSEYPVIVMPILTSTMCYYSEISSIQA